MLFTAIDTETTGKYKKNIPYNHESQPYPLQIGLVSVDADKKPVHRLCLPLKPAGLWNAIEAEAFNIHGITIEYCNQYGVHPAIALNIMNDIIKESEVVVGHFLEHDIKVMSNMADSLDLGFVVPAAKQFCTMKEYAKIAPKKRCEQYVKWPSLDELHQHYFSKPFGGAHNALSDAEASLRCYWEMKATMDMKGID